MYGVWRRVRSHPAPRCQHGAPHHVSTPPAMRFVWLEVSGCGWVVGELWEGCGRGEDGGIPPSSENPEPRRPPPCSQPTPPPTRYTLHPVPYTLHPAPCTLHPTPCTLHLRTERERDSLVLDCSVWFEVLVRGGGAGWEFVSLRAGGGGWMAEGGGLRAEG